MLKQHKKTLIFSSLATLFPILVGLLLWNKLPDRFATHWGIDGQADGWHSLPFAIFFPPLIMFAVQWLCIWVTAKDPGNKGRNKKPFTLVLWIIPVASNLCCGLMYALALGAEFSISSIMTAAFGLMFIAIGNYLPKCKMNSTIGIKVPWTYTSEANWNATHRFGGRVWVIGGLIMMLGCLLPGEWGVWIMLIAVFVLAFIPILYSYLYYRKQKADGAPLLPLPKTGKAGWIALLLILVLVAAVLFTGHINFEFQDGYLLIDTNMYTDYVLHYDEIQSVELRESNVSGLRVGGYGSFRLLMGYFQNEEFGVYIRYTYYKPEACIVLTTSGKTIVLSGETKAQTQALYQELLARISE